MKTYLADAIKALHPEAEFSFSDEDYSTIEWVVLEGKAPTLSEINAQIEKIKADEILEEEQRAANKAALLERLGITAEEAKLLLS